MGSRMGRYWGSRISGHTLHIAAVAAIILAIAVGVACSGQTDPSINSLDPANGPRSGYQQVTISGSGFEDVTSVSFGSAEAVDFTVADPTRIVAKTPAGELGAVVDVTVTAGGGTVTLPDAYTYWDYDLALTKGGTTVTYTLDQLEAMEAVTGYWGAINDIPYATAQYRGVALLTMLEAVGGWSAGEEIVATSADGFVATYTTEMLEQIAGGTYPMWNVNGTEIITDDRFAQLIVAYEIDTAGDGTSWAPLPAGKAPFRIVAATSENDRMSQGPVNPALVTSIEVRAGSATATTAPTATSPPPGDGAAEGTLDPASGPRSGYQNVTIYGSGFEDVTSVSFGSTEVQKFTVADATRIVVKTPAGESGAVVDVTITAGSGTITLPAAYTYWDYDLEVTKGDATVTYTLDQLEAMEAVTGYWGAHKDPVPHIIDQYRGVPLLTLLEAVGGWSTGEEIVVTAADGFVTEYTAEIMEQMADGTYPMWNVNGTEIITDDRFAQLIVAYEIDTAGDGTSWAPLEAGTGPLRIVMITAESDRVNQGKFNPFLAMSIEVISP
jgi:hypothetical protein